VSLPLYRRLRSGRAELAEHGHAGLWYDKFCDQWRQEEEGRWTLAADKQGQPKLEWIRSVTRRRPVGAPGALEEAARRVLRLVRARGGRYGIFVSAGRFVTGLGRSHPVENGFAWHPTLGTPFLPGSSVKGLVRAWVEEERPEEAEALFGSPERAGPLCFLDAVPVTPVRLEPEVLTPHAAGWSAEEPPADWRSPVPVPFLTAAEGTALLFAVVPVAEPGRASLERAFQWLSEALAGAGAGAKTAVCHGRFRHEEASTRRWSELLTEEEHQRREEARRAEAARTPEGRWRLALEGMTEAQVLEHVRVHLEKEPLSEPRERRAYARAVEALGWPARWLKGETQTQVGTKKLKERARLVRQVAEEEGGA
jgi:CRISPR-associated protein Cmr6